MVALAIELTLIAAGILPLLATSQQPARAVNRGGYCGRLGNARRSQ
jgi:hypothetical protein